MLDNYGYNQDESRQLHRVTDLMLVCRLRTEGDRGSLAIRGFDGEEWFRVSLEFPAKQATLYRGDRCLSAASLPAAAYARDVKLEFAICDRQLILAVDERTVLSWANEATEDAAGLRRVPEISGPVPSAARRGAETDKYSSSEPALGDGRGGPVGRHPPLAGVP